MSSDGVREGGKRWRGEGSHDAAGETVAVVGR